jgi:hypothetical protein
VDDPKNRQGRQTRSRSSEPTELGRDAAPAGREIGDVVTVIPAVVFVRFVRSEPVRREVEELAPALVGLLEREFRK